MEVRVLGPLEVVGPNGPVPIPSGKQRAILALLALDHGRVVARARLIDELWGDSPPPTSDHALTVHVTGLRQRLAADALETTAAGYRLRPDLTRTDLARFERLLAEGDAAVRDRDAAAAATSFREALALWRGDALADLDEATARAARTRLDELRQLTLERAIDAELETGRHQELIPELRSTVAAHPLREAAYARLMRALYQAGRQADALEVYHRARAALDSELGVEPGPELERTHRAILSHEPWLSPTHTSKPAADPTPGGEVIVSALDADGFAAALPVARDLARDGQRGLILARLVRSPDHALEPALADLRRWQRDVRAGGLDARTAAFTSGAWGRDLARLGARTSADLVLVGGVRAADDGRLPDEIIELLSEAAIAVGLVVHPGRGQADDPVLVPFGGTPNDWAAVELGAWLARARSTRLTIAGATSATPKAGRTDASRLVADACLVVQRVLRIDAEPVLVDPSPDGLAAAARSASHVVLGLSDRWRDEGIGSFRMAVVRQVDGAVIVTSRGVRPGGLAPPDAGSRFTWSLGGAHKRA
jgi:DNA-binding SARP family transcriptional activator